jgi:hypothetical protein
MRNTAAAHESEAARELIEGAGTTQIGKTESTYRCSSLRHENAEILAVSRRPVLFRKLRISCGGDL